MRSTALVFAVLFLGAADAHGRTERTWRFDGDRREENVGTSVAIVPDVDGDGSPDVVTGAPYHGAQAVEDNKGKAFLLSGVDGAELRVYRGEVVYDGFGFAVAGLSDVDGDGKGDVAVAAPYLDSAAGKVYVFSGGSGAPEAPLYVIEVADRILDGRALSGGPDVDGDLVGDLLVASFSRVALYSGVDGQFIREWSSADGGENFGASAAFTGQVSDGLGGKAQGVLIGAPDRERPPGAFTKGRGRVYVFDAETGDPLRVLDGPDAGSSFGYAVADAGDLNGDAYDDVVIGAPSWGTEAEPLRGKAYVYSGEDWSLLHEFKGRQDYDAAGWSVGTGRDVDGDGTLDIPVGAPGTVAPPETTGGGSKDLSFPGLPKMYFFNLLFVLAIFLLLVEAAGGFADTGFASAAAVAVLLGGKGLDPTELRAYVGAPYVGHAAVNYREGSLYSYRLDFGDCPFERTEEGLQYALTAVTRGLEGVGTAGSAAKCLRGAAGLP